MENPMLGVGLHDLVGPLGDFGEKLMGPDGQSWLTAFKKFLRKENPWTQDLALTDQGIVSTSGEVAVPRSALLVSQGTTTVVLTEEHHPGRFYKTRRGLWVSNDFSSRVVARANKSAVGKSFNLQHATLARYTTDHEIEAELPGTHLFDETDVCAVVARLIAKQPNGEEGTLLNNGYANLFYIASCVVRVSWHADDRLWHVSTWRRDGSRWLAGSQVFSPVTGN